MFNFMPMYLVSLLNFVSVLFINIFPYKWSECYNFLKTTSVFVKKVQKKKKAQISAIILTGAQMGQKSCAFLKTKNKNNGNNSLYLN